VNVFQVRPLHEKRITAGIGVILFGSVARGTADRTSDIDLFVVVDGNRMETQREVHAIERSSQPIQIIGSEAILLDSPHNSVYG